MKIKFLLPSACLRVFSLALGALFLTGVAAKAVTIDAVYFGQTHVKKATDDYFRLVGNRETLIKVHVIDSATPAAPPVSASLMLDDGSSTTISLSGPATLPASIPDGFGVIQHTFDDSFTAMIPKEWVKPGLEVVVNAGSQQKRIDVNVGAPTKMSLTLSNVQLLDGFNYEFPTDYFDEYLEKMPFAELDVRTIPEVLVEEIVVRPENGARAVRVRSKAGYLDATGNNMPSLLSQMLGFNRGIANAGGRNRDIGAYFILTNQGSGGLSFLSSLLGSSDKNMNLLGTFHHEMGHGFSLPHNNQNSSYPYIGDMYGIPAGGDDRYHSGPVWAFDRRGPTFIPPIQETGDAIYKKDPMQGGGTGGQGPGFHMIHFSDYNIYKMTSFLEQKLAVWDEAEKDFFKWNDQDKAYTTPVTRQNELSYPVIPEAEVYTLAGNAYLPDLNVSLVYPPLGPYKSGLIRLFDPTDPQDRADAQSVLGDCDFTFRVVQGGVERFYLIDDFWNPDVDPLSQSALRLYTLNVPASHGEIIRADLLLTPDAQLNGLPAEPTLLYTWASTLPAQASFLTPPTAARPILPEITMSAAGVQTAAPGNVEYRFTEISGNPGGTSSGWIQTATYTDTGLQPGTTFTYQVEMRDANGTSIASAPFPRRPSLTPMKSRSKIHAPAKASCTARARWNSWHCH